MIGSGVTSIGDAAFFGCSGLGNITIPDSVVTIGNGAFYSCTNLSGIVIPNSVTNIGEAAFYSCGALTNATLGSNVVSIGTSAFRKCTNLTAVAIPNSVTNIGVATFRDCSNLADITVNAANPTYCSLDGVLFDKDLTVLIQYPEGKTGDFTIPTTVTAIDDYAFHNCKRVESLILPNDVLSIGAGAFRNCTQLNSVTIPGSITNIGAYAFADCTDLTDVYVQCGTNSLNGLDPFENDGITVYHRAGTTGWDTALPGYSIFEWNPKALGLSMGRNGFEFTVTNAGSPSVKIEASTNLTDSVWEPMQTITLTDGSQTVTDSSSTNRPARFYRLSMP
jgi:hypothetical protein